MKAEVRSRKIRSDKKKDIKPTLPVHYKDAVFRLSYITEKPVKDVAEHLVLEAIKNKDVIDNLSVYLRRDYTSNNTFFIGHNDNPNLREVARSENFETDRLTIRFLSADKGDIDNLAYSLDVTTSMCASFLVRLAVSNQEIINCYLKEFLCDNLSDAKMMELEKALQFINGNVDNEEDEEIGWIELLSYFAEEVAESKGTVISKIKTWLKRKK